MGFFGNVQFDPMIAFVFTAIHTQRDVSQLLFLVCLEPVSYIVNTCLADFIQHKLFKTKCFLLVSVTMPWRNSGVQYLYAGSVFSLAFVQGYDPKCCLFLVSYLELSFLLFCMKLSQIKKYVFPRTIFVI